MSSDRPVAEHGPEPTSAEVTSSLPTEPPLQSPRPETRKPGAGATEMASHGPAGGATARAEGGDLIDFGESPPSLAATGVVKDETVTQSSSAQAPEEEHSDTLSASVATLKPTTAPKTTTATQFLAIDTKTYVDPTPATPVTSQPPSRTPSNAATRSRRSSNAASPSPSRSDGAYDEKRYLSEDEQETGSRSEIQSIMEQFSEAGGGPDADEVMSPRLEIAAPMLGSPIIQHPPRQSSLEPLAQSLAQQLSDMQTISGSSPSSSPTMGRASKGKEPDEPGPPVPPKDTALSGQPQDNVSISLAAAENAMSPTLSLYRPPPPEPEPEPALPFDFHRFLEQLRNKKADPVARYLKSFLSEFGKRQWMVHEQVKIIGDFLAFIANKMAQCDVWSEVTDAEFDNAREGMEKLVMNRLYSQTFSPAIPPPQPIPGSKPKRKGGERPMGPGRRGQHQEDVERDEILAQKINIYSWVRAEHLDIPPVADSGRRFLKLAQEELKKISSYRAPRDKIICVLNCCKVIFGLLKHSKSDSSADSFMPLLIYVALQANPDHLVSNVQYILRFRNQDKLSGEAGYYLSSLMGAIQFIENMDRTTLTITDEEFEHNVEAAVLAIAEKHPPQSPPPPPSQSEKPTSLRPAANISAAGEASSSSTRPSLDLDHATTPRRSTSSRDGGGPDSSDEKAAITGLLRSIQRPLSTIGRMFSDETGPGSGASGQHQQPPSRSPAHTPLPLDQPARRSEDLDDEEAAAAEGGRPASRRRSHQLSAQEAAARQASAEAAEAQRLHRAEHANIVETLSGMFPDLDRDIISDVVYQKQGRVGLAVDACLALST